VQEGDTYRVKQEIRNMVIFAQHDLVKNPPYCNMHLISCRNVLIYMSPVLQKKVLTQFLFGLKKGGYLFLGPSENPLTITRKLELENKKWKIFKNLEQKKTVSFDAFSLPLLNIQPLSEKFFPKDVPVIPQASLAEAMNNALVKKNGSLTVCIDENNLVVKTYGDTGRFLLQKNFTSHFPDLLPEVLSIAFNTIRKEVIKTGKETSLNGIKIIDNKTTIDVCMSITPLVLKKGESRFLMVVFSEENLSSDAQQLNVMFNDKLQIDQYTKNLEGELREIKEELKSVYLQLDAFRENMQSYNEEMIAANEEMQSTNEEMQSINEELHTINSEYQVKNKELEEVNSDLDNYFRSNINGQLFVNKELVLMKFSPGTVKQINLLPADIGRPLSNISTNIKFETLAADIKEVLSKKTVITKEIETNNDRWYQVMTMPYLQQPDNNINGAIITFNDITELKKAQLEITLRNKILERLNQELDNFVLTASHDLLAPLSNIEMSIAVMNKLTVVGPELNEYLTVINSSVKKFRSLITDIATVSKVENSMLVQEMVDIDDVLDNIIWSMDSEIKKSNAVIERKLNVKRIHFSKNNLRSVLYNLISNSIKYKRDQPPEITITTSWEDHHIILTVEDNGIGIAKEDNKKVFAMYGRLQSTVDGQGIGLYLVQKIMDVAGGRVVIESDKQKGTKFIIHFKP
jgi:two-component system CheB/CheR fusion protein